MALNCVDVSNYTGPLSADALAAWKALGVQLVIVQAIDPPPDYPPRVDQQQADAVLAAGLALGAYVEHFTGTSIAQRNADRFAAYGYPIERWWSAFEDTTQALATQREAECELVLAHLDTLGAKRSAGAYTGPWYASYLPPGSQVFTARQQWVAQYDGVDTPSAQSVCGGIVTVHQYIGTTMLAGVAGVDIDCAMESEFLDVPPDPTPTPPPTPEPDYRVALASVTSPTGEIVPKLDAAMKLTSAKAMRAAVAPERNRLVAVYNEFKP